jgi:DNA-binding NarL/FixJ family response regulator
VRVGRVLIAAPHPLLREGIRMSMAGTGLDLCDAADIQTAVGAANAAPTDAALVDLDLPGGGMAAVRCILAAHPPARVAVLADRTSDAEFLESVRAGAVGYLDKNIESATLPRVVLAVLAGEAVVPRRLTGLLLRETRMRAVEPSSEAWSPVRLTRREFEVLDLMRAGLTTAGIAERLFVSPGTVRSHVMAMMRKLQVGDRAALIEMPGGPPSARQAVLR